MTTRSSQGSDALPEGCIRGPELTDRAAIGAEIRAADPAALAAYQQGMELLIAARTLLDMQTRLQELSQTRAFLLHQLATLERQHPEQFAEALAAYDRRRASRGTAPAIETDGAARTSEEACPCEPPQIAAP